MLVSNQTIFVISLWFLFFITNLNIIKNWKVVIFSNGIAFCTRRGKWQGRGHMENKSLINTCAWNWAQIYLYLITLITYVMSYFHLYTSTNTNTTISVTIKVCSISPITFSIRNILMNRISTLSLSYTILEAEFPRG